MKATGAKAVLQRAQADPVWFLKTVLGVDYLTPQQESVIASVVANRRTAVPAGNGLGKTFLSARLALWFLYTHPASKVVTTAPTWNQVVNLLWRELRHAHNKSRFPLGGQVNQTQLNLGDDWFAIGLSTDDATRFQGIHAPHVMVIFDEATGVSADIWQAAEGLAVGPNDRFLAIGNPTNPLSEFKRACDSGLWNVIELSGEEHPNVLQGEAVIPGAVTKEWIDERLIEYGGKDTPLYRARVLGRWPDQSEDSLISLAVVEAAQQRWTAPEGKLMAAGCDVARFGADETVVAMIYEAGMVAPLSVRRGQDLMATAGQLKVLGAEKLGVDDGGLGGGVTDRLVEQKIAVVPVVAGSSATDDSHFVNLRAEMWWALREALKAGDISLPDDRKLAADLTNVKFGYDSRGRVKLESKDEIRKRIGRSPDRGDALAIANWVRLAQSKKVSVVRWDE